MTDEESEAAGAQRLAEEIRRGIREVLPAPDGEPEKFFSGLRAWDDAERFALPAVPAGASFPRVKRLMLRVLRLVTRSQGAFNMKLLEGARSLDRSLSILRQDLEDAESRMRRASDVLHARLAVQEGPGPARTGPREASAAALSDGLYVRFEEEFRGSEQAIAERQSAYAGFFRGAPGPVLDCGCGRGEFVELLAAAGIPATGVDANRLAITLARKRGVDAEEGDAFVRLRTLKGTLGGVSALQFVEHLAPAAVEEFLALAFEALAPGGRLLLETINPDSLYAMRAYRLDPTHVWPVPARTLALFAREAGFREKEIRFVSPVPATEALAETGDNERKLNRWIFGFQDYAYFAERPEG
jgi:SAM-dependent methyltransferase